MQAQGIPEKSLVAFKECDIRGEYEHEITPDFAYKLGRAIGTVAQDKRAIIGGDFRLSTPLLLDELTRGLVESGTSVVDLGQLSTPVYYFARRRLDIKTGVMVTASHNPPGWNGFKPALGDLPITPQEVENLRDLMLHGDFTGGQGSIEQIDVKREYVDWLAQRFAGLGSRIGKVLMDCGNGATGWVIKDVIKALDLKAGVLFGEPDGRFPNRSSDISKPDDLITLQVEVKRRGAALGFGFDGDGDRVGLVDEQGNRISSDRLIAWLARELVQRAGGGAVIYDLKLSRLVPEFAEQSGGKPILQKSGHTFIKTSMLKENAVFGGEYSGHLFYRELAGGDDGLYSALLMCSLIADAGKPVSQIFAAMPNYFSTPDLRIKFTGEKEALLQKAAAHAQSEGARLVSVDGVRAEYPDGWALMRGSVTESALTFRFEGSTKDNMLKVARSFLDGIGEIGDPIWSQVVKSSGK